MSDNLGGSLGGGSFVIAPSQQSVFNMNEESSVISLLKLIHQNPFDAETKNHLRDLIFTYRQTQTKENLAAIRDACLPFGVSITVPNNESKAEIAVQQLSTFGTTRPQPLFRSLGKETAKAVLSETVLEPVVVMPQQWPKSDQTPTDAQPVVVQTRIQETSPLQQDAPVLTKEKSNSVVHVDVQERIKEIKKLVNDKVGNPINLIDAHNEVGREYMNALLDAMKKSNGGKLEEVEQAMERLETAFAHVQGAITGNGEMKKEIVSHGEQSASSIAKMPEDKNVAAEADAQQVDISPLENVTPVATEPMAQIRTIPVVHVQPENREAIERVQPEPAMTTSHANLSVPLESHAVNPYDTDTKVEQRQTPQPVVPTPSYSDATTIHSVAKDKQLQDLMRTNIENQSRVQKQEEEKKIAAMDPLFTPEVSAGLNQLLSEWSLFKSSGIFGTGPSGKDHVLYQKISELTMSAVVAGRFEGATPKIKQSIADYMNGWRYEESVIHEQGETFEHYLRRVVKHILEKQKRMNTAAQ